MDPLMTAKLIRPTPILDKKKAEKNISKLKTKADENNLVFRPHFKTHQSIGVGKWFQSAGVKKITVSSVKMARYFNSAGWNDITIAVTANWAETDQINLLAELSTINIVVDSLETVEFLVKRIENEIGVFIKIDTGYGRTGIHFNDISQISRIKEGVDKSRNLRFEGFLTHNGLTYGCGSTSEILESHNESVEKIVSLKENFPEAMISIGDTPGCSVSQNFYGVDEIRPGNFVFYDLMQHSIGACDFNEIALLLACPVISKNRERNEIAVYGGAVHLSKELIIDSEKRNVFGRIVVLNDDLTWTNTIENASVSRLSQEHGIISLRPDDFDKIELGTFLGIVPVHSCLTANLHGGFLTTDGEIISTINKTEIE